MCVCGGRGFGKIIEGLINLQSQTNIPAGDRKEHLSWWVQAEGRPGTGFHVMPNFMFQLDWA